MGVAQYAGRDSAGIETIHLTIGVLTWNSTPSRSA